MTNMASMPVDCEYRMTGAASGGRPWYSRPRLVRFKKVGKKTFLKHDSGFRPLTQAKQLACLSPTEYRKAASMDAAFLYSVGDRGVEPLTSTTSMWRSTN